MEDRISLIKKYLDQEGNAYTVDEMPDAVVDQLCTDFNVDESQIVGFYEDVMQLGGALFASLRSRYNTRGVLFLEDKFLYNKGILLHGIIEMPYENIKFVERNIASTVIYTGEFNEDGTNKTLKLGGLSFEESSPVPMLLEEIRNLNEDTIVISKLEKYKDKGKKALNFAVDFAISSILETANKAERELHKNEQQARNILNNQGNHTQEEIDSAKELLSNHVENEGKLRDLRGVAINISQNEKYHKPEYLTKDHIISDAKKKVRKFDEYTINQSSVYTNRDND